MPVENLERKIIKVLKKTYWQKKNTFGRPNFYNYKPVSMISNISKLIENTMQKRPYFFRRKEQLLSEGQFGFRNNRSTADTLTDITERTRDVCDKGLYACATFLGFEKAFDTVNHGIILDNTLWN